MLLADSPVAYLVFPVITEIINGYQFAMTWEQGGGLQRLPKLVAGTADGRPSRKNYWADLSWTRGDLQETLQEGWKAVGGVVLAKKVRGCYISRGNQGGAGFLITRTHLSLANLKNS